MEQVFNPYLPLDEYVPDGEPRVFGDRLYIYGSHDRSHGNKYCELDYVVWSAPVDDLTDWTCHGTSYRKEQDPSNPDGALELWAPDVVQGPDGRYYLYYCLAFTPEIGVAVSDKPEGPFEFYGHVKYDQSIRDGAVLHEHLPFDPAVLVDDDGRIYLYYGNSAHHLIPKKEDLLAQGMTEEEIEFLDSQFPKMEFSEYNMVVELQTDMVTMIGEPKGMVPGSIHEQGTSFEGHPFFEAASIRKINGKYYFVYSSKLKHELCYAISDYPDRDFVYGGTIVSNCDIGFNGNDKARGMIGNNHGGIIGVKGQYYIFYHRQTQGTETSRQGCAEKITILPDGSIPQVEITSCGLNNGPLVGAGSYDANIVCNIISPKDSEKIVYGEVLCSEHTYVYEELELVDGEKVFYVSNIFDGVALGYKYFACHKLNKIMFIVRGNAKGALKVRLESESGVEVGAAEININADAWYQATAEVAIPDGVHALFFCYEGDGAIQLRKFDLQ